jgi:hypothetical protein
MRAAIAILSSTHELGAIMRITANHFSGTRG